MVIDIVLSIVVGALILLTGVILGYALSLSTLKSLGIGIENDDNELTH